MPNPSGGTEADEEERDAEDGGKAREQVVAADPRVADAHDLQEQVPS